MFRPFSTRLRLPLFSVAAVALAVTTTTALAGSGVGGVFNLGQTNTVDAQTTLNGNPGANPELKVVNSGSAAAIRAETNSADPSSAGVLGKNNGGGPGLRAIVNAGVPPLMVNSTVRVPSLNADLLDGVDSTGFWKLGGNAGTSPGVDFLGTTDNRVLEVKVNGQRALRLEPPARPMTTSPNVIGGFSGNAVLAGAVGATIGGGGESAFGSANRVTDDFGTVGGGSNNVAGDQDAFADPTTAQFATVAGGVSNTASRKQSTVGGGFANTASGTESTVAGGGANTASGPASFIAGGVDNTASGFTSFAAGRWAKATDDGSFVWADDNGFDIGSNGADTFTARTTGGARFISAIDGTTGAPTAGVSLAAGGGSWASLSDRAAKRGFSDIDRGTLLQRLDRVPITRWGYKAQAASIRHLGPTAQDFRAAFGLGEDAKHIGTIDSEGVALAAIQGVYRQNLKLQRENVVLRGELKAQNVRLARLERAVLQR
jgi:Chaperone of endosialidase